MKHLILDGSKIHSIADFHSAMNELLDFGPYYGNNSDALWDMMSGGIGLNVFLHWTHSQYAEQSLGGHYQIILSIFNDVKALTYQGSSFNYSLE
ncbi:MAG: barstar family protein [Neisseria sp.]|nr:barstar family protein [Neisseria sp.]